MRVLEHARARFRHAPRAGNTHTTHAASTRTHTRRIVNSRASLHRATVRIIARATVETGNSLRQALLVYLLRLRVRERHMLTMRTPATPPVLRLRPTTLHTTITTPTVHELHSSTHRLTSPIPSSPHPRAPNHTRDSTHVEQNANNAHPPYSPARNVPTPHLAHQKHDNAHAGIHQPPQTPTPDALYAPLAASQPRNAYSDGRTRESSSEAHTVNAARHQPRTQGR